jgi:twinkle protein
MSSKFIEHTNCEACGSSDANAIYEDDSSHCFSCGKHVFPDAGKFVKVDKPEDLEKHQGCFTFLPLQKRRISQETCKFYDYRQGYHKGTFVHAATHYDRNKKACAIKLRYPDKSFPWLGEENKATLYGQQLFEPHANLSVIITEGHIDCLSIAEIQGCKWPVVSLKGGAQSAKKELQAQFEWLNGFKEIRLCFDNDEAGKKAVEDCLSIPFAPGKLKVINLPLKDASDMLQQGRIKDLQNCLFNARVYRPDSIINSKDITEEMIMAKPPKGLSLPYTELNNMLRGTFPARLTVVTAGWGFGKSTLLKEIAYHLVMEHKQKVGCIFLEENKQETLLSFIGMHENTPVVNLLEDDELRRKAFLNARSAIFDDGLLEIYEHGGEKRSDTLLDRVEYMAAALGCQWIIFDHLTYIVSGIQGGNEGDRKVLDLLLNRLDSIKLRTGCSIFTACQLRKTSDSKGANNGAEVQLQGLKGSGEIAGIADVCLALEGDQQSIDNGNERRIRVLKNRPTGKVGMADTLEYNEHTGRLTEKFTAFNTGTIEDNLSL